VLLDATGVNERVCCTVARIAVRVAELLGKVVEKICPAATVKDTGLPVAVPLEFENEIVPVQDAAVPLVGALAVFTTLT